MCANFELGQEAWDAAQGIPRVCSARFSSSSRSTHQRAKRASVRLNVKNNVNVSRCKLFYYFIERSETPAFPGMSPPAPFSRI
jgi:hypothetical protein